MDVVAIIVFFLTLAGAQENQLNGPQNTLSVVGSNVTLKCSSPSRNCDETEWLKRIASGNQVTVFNDRGIISSAYNSAHRYRYSVDNSSGCDLIIKNVELTDAGRFICRVFISSQTFERTAYLIIQDCTITAFRNETEEREGVLLNCTVIYSGIKRASMVWKELEDLPVHVENGERISHSVYVVAFAPEVPSFTCVTSFPVNYEEFQIHGLATNIPNTTCATSTIKVLYSVRNVALSPSRSHYALGSVINCNAQGHPAPTFKWQEMEVDGIWTDIENLNGSEFTMTNVSTNQYRCVAMNVVKSKSYNATSLEFFVNNRDSDTTTLPLHLILMASVAGGLFLLIILLIVCFSVRSCLGFACCHPGEKTKDKISEVQPLTESPDICIYSVVNKVQNSPPKAKPSSHPNMKSPQGASPQALPRTGNPKTDHTTAYQHEEVTYADLAMEVGPRQAVPKYSQPPQETLYAAVGAA